jgi:hypothetical protein
MPRSNSFGHPPYAMPPPWFPYGQPRQPPLPPFPGMPPLPPGYQQPQYEHSVASSNTDYAAYIPRPAVAAAAAAAAQRACPFSDESAKTQPPTPMSDRTTAGYPSSYSISLSVAAGPSAMPGTRTEAHMSWSPSRSTPSVQSSGRRKRSRPLYGITQKEPSSPASPYEDMTPPTKSPNKTDSATQTPQRFHEPRIDARVAMRSTPMATGTHLHPFQPPLPAVLYPPIQRPPQGHVHYGQNNPLQYEQSTFDARPQPSVRSFSEPIFPAHTGLEPEEYAGANKDGASSVHSMIERSAHATESPRNFPRRIRLRYHDEGNDPSAPITLHEGGTVGLSRVARGEGNDLTEPLLAAPNVDRTRAGLGPPLAPECEHQPRGARRQSKMLHGAPPVPDEGMDWFQGQLLLESDEDTSEHGNDKYQYPV